MTKLATIEGIGEIYEGKLKAAGVTTLEGLRQAGATPKGRKDLAAAAGIADTLILKWVNRADLFRIKGIGEEYSDLLEAAGVDTVPELAQRKPENLHNAMLAKNSEKNLVRQMPTLKQVADWVEQATSLPREISY